MSILLNIVALLVMPVLVHGVINRVKARWAGRVGPPIFQLAFDLWRLAHKTPVYSEVTTPVFRVGPAITLVTSLASACIVPLAGGDAIVSFPFDFVWFAYVWSFGRVALMLGALDTGSAFEGMGASREATFSTLLEPVLFLVAGALCLHAGVRTFAGALVPHLDNPASAVLWLGAVAALLIVIQVEAARMPVDDPTTHLELTMVHEVMVLDHSGPELAMLQASAAIKTFVAIAVTATLLDPLSGRGTFAGVVAHLGICFAVAIGLGLVESLIARLKLRIVPPYIVVALVAAAIALLSTLGRGGFS